MKKQTYDVPAYKFGIAKISCSQKGESYSVQDYQYALQNARCAVIPFENVDGLTMEEIKDFIGIKELHFLSYMRYEDQTADIKENYFVMMQVYVDEQLLNKNSNTPIDQIIEKTLEDNYDKFDYRQKKACCCFFERYQDREYELTKERIKRLEQPK